MLRKISSGRVAIAAFATLVVSNFSGALAQSADLRPVADVEKENASLRARIHRLEVEKENANLRAKLQQLKGQPAPVQIADRAPAPQPASTRELIDYAGGGDPKMGAFAMAPYYSWTGFYIGGNVGYGAGSDRTSGSLISSGIAGVTGADTPVVPAGATGGVQFGYNWQGGPNWLAGFEADFQGSAQKGTSCVFLCLNAPALQVLEVITAQHTLDYFGTVRGRFGFVNNNTLFYVTGGGAYGHVNQTLQSTFSEGNATFASASTGENKFGFVVGAGLEASLGGNWTGKVEYLYMDLGSTSGTLNGTIPTVTPAPFTLTTSSTLHDNIVRAGLNYRFGAPGAYNALAADLPVKASVPERVYSWTGFYAGANIGYGFGNDHDLTTEMLTAGGTSVIVTSDPGASVAPKGAIGGVQLGYNWQASPHLLAGFEADLQGSAQTDTACSAGTCLNSAGGTNFNTVQHQLDYFGTLRGRLGAINGNVLYYATGGAAFAHVTQTFTVNSSQSTAFASGNSSADMIGWTVGGGIEAALWGGWTAKAEYLYMNLGSISTTVNVSPPGEQVSLATTSTIRDHIVRIGANYHFNNGPDIIATRY